MADLAVERVDVGHLAGDVEHAQQLFHAHRRRGCLRARILGGGGGGGVSGSLRGAAAVPGVLGGRLGGRGQLEQSEWSVVVRILGILGSRSSCTTNLK